MVCVCVWACVCVLLLATMINAQMIFLRRQPDDPIKALRVKQIWCQIWLQFR